MMTVGLVVHDYDPNYGQGRYCVELVKRLHDRVRFTIFANTFNAPEFPGVTKVYVPAVRYNALTTVFSFVPSGQRKVRNHPVDLLHAQGLTCWQSDIITGHICNAARVKRMNTKWIKPRLFMWLVIPFERRFYRHKGPRRLIAISRCLEREVREHYAWDKRASVIYHGTNPEQFRPAKDAAEREELRARFKVSGDRWTWLFMGEATKGLRQSIDQLTRFPEARLLVITRSRLEEYREQATQLGVGDRVVFHGFEPNPELAFRAADLFIYPSDYDPFGMVVTEAMASGIPVAVGKDLGSAELIENEVNGLLFDPHDANDIALRLRQVGNDPALAKSLARLGRATILHHGWDACAEATYNVYREVLAEKRAG